MEYEEKIPSCDCVSEHRDIVEKVRKEMSDDEIIYDMAELFKVFGDSTRVKILDALFVSEMCVCDLASVLEMKQSAVSHQLRILKQARLIKFRKEGKAVYYSMADEHVRKIFDQAINHLEE
ncbi:MAG TPA: metalloregulator ArsR/SmtB family transcription factor [Petrotogaceae bacterium]|jgi:ArsR family transcriptional regulator|nr:metalloregulator ArsR/SmtB family transcription factor [Petrotogaceae bacterium]HPA93167.1 metalloregulator ArsR/SmtB family transcription factor [Petrotogaceae bacterium]HPO27916.1 metalloregulator ArsR/SmtB family transcription factor [Petrotogaceae bacterium]HPO27979.1 metalloregulator ArsR/SmtB family transcription factor [Petrotogaceae bacterium]HQC41676.1 metalloregulator ArsR/SmtB family transcription factor [Petrotogaceae bacterium]